MTYSPTKLYLCVLTCNPIVVSFLIIVSQEELTRSLLGGLGSQSPDVTGCHVFNLYKELNVVLNVYHLNH